MSGDFRTTVLLDELNAIEIQMEEIRPEPRRVLRDFSLYIIILVGLGLFDAPRSILILTLLGLPLIGVTYLAPVLRLRALDRQRTVLLERLSPLERLREVDGGSHDVP